MTDKSINASERLEMPIMTINSKGFVPVLSEMFEVAKGNPNYSRRINGQYGVNPTHSLETGIK